MKKTILLSLAALAAVSLSATAFADNVSLTKISTLSGVNGWVSGTDLVYAGDYSNGYAIATMDGNVLTDQVYSGYGYTRNGYFDETDQSVEAPHNQCLFSVNGVKVIDAAYGKIDVENEHWAIAYTYAESDANQYDEEDYRTDKYYLYDTADVYFLDGDSAVKVGSFARANIKDYYAEGYYINIEDRSTGTITTYDSSFTELANPDSIYRFGDLATTDLMIYSENGQQGIKDREGNVVMTPAFKYIYDIQGNYVRVYNGEKYGLTDLSGNVIVPAEYDSIERDYNAPVVSGSYSSYVSGSYICVELDDKLGYVDVNGNLTVEPTYSTNIFDHKGASSTYTDMANDFHILAADGTDTVLPAEMTEARALSYGSGYLYKYSNSNYDYGLIDWHGTELFPAEYEGFELSGDGKYLLAFTDYTTADLYEVSYDLQVSAAAQTETAPADDTANAGTDDAGAAALISPETAKALISSAQALASVDASANAQAISTLLSQAVAALDSNSPVVTILNSAITLLGSGSTDGVASLLTSAVTLLG